MKVLGEDEIDDLSVERPKQKRAEFPVNTDTNHNIEAVHVFSEVGSLAETSRRLGISIYDLQRMSREPWWQRELQGIQREQTAIENVRLTSMWGRTLDQMGDMLDKGVIAHYRGKVQYEEDELGEKTGEPCRVPLSPAMLAKFAEVLFTQRQLVRELPTAIVGSNSKLEELADKLSQLGSVRAAAKVIDADVTDVGEEDGSE